MNLCQKIIVYLIFLLICYIGSYILTKNLIFIPGEKE